ncbi:MAG: acyl-CoA carboxylase subunit beta [Thermodesulfobacteriota bacterium]
MEQALKKLDDLRERAALGGGRDKIRKLKEKGYLTCDERIALLADSGTFVEWYAFAGPQPAEFGPDPPYMPRDGVVTGFATVAGRTVGLYAHDKTVQGGSLGNVQAAKITHLIKKCCELQVPLIALQDSVGARIQEGNKNVGFDSIFYALTQASGVIPSISVILGTCAGGIAYSSALMDFVVMVKEKSQLFITGPGVIKSVTHEDISVEALGGSRVHAEKSGVCDMVGADEADALRLVRELLDYLPDSCQGSAPRCDPRDDPGRGCEPLLSIMPSDTRKAYDMRKILHCVLDEGHFFEIKARFARNILTGFGRMDGRSVGVIANQPSHLGGTLDVDASDKGSRFIRFCDAFNIPILTFVDVPGYLPGVDQEYKGIIRHGAKMLFAYAEATVPKITVICRKDYGGGKQAMCSKPMGTDCVLAWPGAELAVMGAEGAVNVICRQEIEESDDPEGTRRRLIQEYRDIFDGPFESARKMYVDDIIDPRETRSKIISVLRILRNKRVARVERKHANMPL